MSHSDWMLEVKALSKSVPDAGRSLSILRDVNLRIPRGQSLAVTGASGSGKSTLLGLMAGLDIPDGGDVLLDGVSVFSLDEEGRAALRASRVGFVFQSFQLLGHLNALENVMLPLELMGEPNATARALQMLEHVGMSSRATHFPKTLSGGEQQRVALARAFVTKPKLIFADEPTGSLDAANGEKIAHLLFDLRAEHGTTVVLVTHALELAQRCDHVLKLSAGRTV